MHAPIVAEGRKKPPTPPNEKVTIVARVFRNAMIRD
jgi:hypothetical protein